MSNIKLPQGSDYHGNAKYYSKAWDDYNKDTYREKFPKGSDWKEPEPNPFGEQRISSDAWHGMETIGVSNRTHNQAIAKIDKLERDLEYSRGCLETKDKYWDKIRVERNSFLLEKQNLEEKVKELETELYFCRRNKLIGEIVDG